MLNILMNTTEFHPCVKSVRIRSFSDQYFPAFGLNTENALYLCLFNPNVGKYGPENSEYGNFLESPL